MPVVFFDSRSGDKSCSCGGKNLHSAYNPVKEAERFVQGISFDFIPKAVIITFPCISYCAQYLRNKFPGAKIYAVQASREFSIWDKDWDKVFYFSENLGEELYSVLGDEVLISTLFLSWQPAENVFEKEFKIVWDAFKQSVLKSRNILNTRSYFSKRWIKNSFRFNSFIKNTAEIIPGTKDIIICASGPSLKTSLPEIKKIRQKLFLICVSSALSPLAEYGIIPDLCVTTDGGFYAKNHLSFHLKDHKEIVIAAPFEASLYGWNYENAVLPLSYGDGPSEDIIKESTVKTFPALRNGTVSGTAGLLALKITSGNVYFCGLDLSPSQGFVHTQPNELEINDSLYDNRLRTKETRLTPSTFSSQSLQIYCSWFSNNCFNGRLFRLSSDFNYSNNLKNVPDVNWKYFSSHFDEGKVNPKLLVSKNNTEKALKNISSIKVLLENRYTDTWLNDAFPVESVLLERKKNTPDENKLRKELISKMNVFSSGIISRLEDK